MANLWLDLKGPILADTVYCDGVLSAKDVTITLPAVTLVTADFKAMGTYTAPLTGQIEAMEASITKIGIDYGLRNIVKLQSKTLEIRWAQDVKYADGSSKTEGCKAFLRSVPKLIPGLSVDPGNLSENEITLAVSRYQLFVAGNEFWLIDQLNTIMRVDGVDYAKDLRSVL
jgi:P2 family phage contractile tail tube protein